MTYRVTDPPVAITESDKRRGYWRTRRLIPQRDRCEKCGSDGNGRIYRHHKDENPLNTDLSNIAFLCPACHAAAHSREDLLECCPHGHPWTPENTYYGSRPDRRCRACLTIAQRAYRQRKAAQA